MINWREVHRRNMVKQPGEQQQDLVDDMLESMARPVKRYRLHDRLEDYLNVRLDKVLKKLGHGRGTGRIVLRKQFKFSREIYTSREIYGSIYEQSVLYKTELHKMDFWDDKHLYVNAGPVFLNLPWPIREKK